MFVFFIETAVVREYYCCTAVAIGWQLCASRFLGDVIRLSVGKLLVNHVQVVKRTDTPLLPQQMASSIDPGFLGRGFDPHHPQ